MASSLTVRNLSSAPILINCVERFEDPHTLQSKPSVFSFTSSNTTSAAPSASKLGEHAGTFNRHDPKVPLSPFESFTLGHQEAGANGDSTTLASTTLRLTIEGSKGERFRIDINPSYTQKSTQAFTPLTPNPSSSYTALFHPIRPIAHLTIHGNHLHDFRKWMDALPSNLPLSALSIPGTHNSHTCYRALPSVRCQVVPVKTQLEHGIRFLDIRVQPSHPTDISKKDLYLVHGAFPVSLTGTKYLEPVLQSCYDFLSENPSETILISLKREGVGSATDEHLASLLEEHYITPNASKWHIDPRIPYLGAVRGKLVLVRRYTHAPIDKGYGLDATAWPNNSAHATHGPFCIQDFCDVLHPSTIAQKLQYSNEHLVRTAEQVALIPGINTDTTNPVPPGPLYLNFLSGANFWHAGCWPDKIAKIVNRGMEEWIVSGHHLEEPLTSPGEPGRTSVDVEGRAAAGGLSKAKKGDGGAGVVVMDCVGENGDWDLVELIVGLNMGVKMAAEGP